jgi:hemerythrin-like domain-containing protein
MTLAGLLGADHRRIDAQLADISDLVTDGEIERAESYFADLDQMLRRHIGMEEELLFPALDVRFRGPVQVMRHEHRRIIQLLAEVGAALERSAKQAACEALGGLLLLLGEHNQKEEHILYPASDGTLDESAHDRLVEEINHNLRQVG